MFAAVFAMGDIVRRLFAGARPIDWLVIGIDALVLIVIACEWGIGELRLRADRKERKRIAAIVADLSGLMDKGQKVRDEVASPDQPEQIPVWQTRAETWSQETDKFLSDRSPRASAAFRLIVGSGMMGQIVRTSSGKTLFLDHHLRYSYEGLVGQLHNLRGIMEKPEAYF